MRLLLDTHALIWLLEGDPQLSPRVRHEVSRPNSELWVSAATLWELTIKVSLGKLGVAAGLPVLFNQVLPEQRIAVLPLMTSHLLRLEMLPLHHRDPFDRLLAAQAVAESLTLASKDEILDAYGVSRLW
jgi:PIN domain nuclease of toxin-antitoxin system